MLFQSAVSSVSSATGVTALTSPFRCYCSPLLPILHLFNSTGKHEVLNRPPVVVLQSYGYCIYSGVPVEAIVLTACSIVVL